MNHIRPALILLLLILFSAKPATGSAQSVPIAYERYDVDISVAADGSFRVREIQRIRFDGEFSSAFAEIPLAYTDTITDVVVYEGSNRYEESRFSTSPGTYTWDQTGNNVVVEWNYTETDPGAVKTFVLEYTVVGGLWVYDNEYTLEWRAIPGDRSGIVVEQAQVTVSLPTTPEPERMHYAANGADYSVDHTPGIVRFTLAGPLADGTPFQVLVGFPKEGITSEKQSYQIREEADELVHRIEAVDVNMFIQPDGRVLIEEAHRVSVIEGRLTQGERVLPLAYTDRITSVEIYEGEQRLTHSVALCDDCFTVSERNRRADWIRYDASGDVIRVNEREAGQLALRWQVPPLVPGEATTFIIRYEVLGLIVTEDSGQRFDWNVLFDTRRVEELSGERVDLRGTPAIESASLRLHMPAGVDPSRVTLTGGVPVLDPDGTLLLSRGAPLPPGGMWEVEVHLPAFATTASPPLWQTELDRAREAQAVAAARFARQQLVLGAGGVLTLVAGATGTFILWFTRGRDREAAVQAEYLSEPPSSLPPGIVSFLIEEEATTKGVMASLFHLATLGILQITFDGAFLVRRNLEETELQSGQEIVRTDDTTALIPTHLVMLYNDLAPHIPADRATRMSNIYPHFVKALPRVYERMGEEANVYFTANPVKAAFRWKSAGQGLILLGLAATAVAYFAARAIWGDVVLFIPGALTATGVLLWLVSGTMAQKSALGAAEAAKWEAFARYLRSLKQYGNLDEAQRVLDDYFAYAVALDVEQVVLEQAAEFGTAPPSWTWPATVRPEPPFRGNDSPARSGRALPPLRTVPAPNATAGDPSPSAARPDWSIQGASNAMAAAISDVDHSLASLLNRAGGVDDGTTPFDIVRSGVEGVGRSTLSATKTTFEVIGDILESASSGGGSGGYSGGSSSRSSSGSSSWGRSSSRSSGSSRSSSGGGSRRSGGGGSRGFR